MTELDEALKSLIQTYGIAEVRKRLALIGRTLPKRRRTAPEIVDAMDVPTEQKHRLHTLAKRFQEKEFLPTAGEVRNMFEAFGYPTGKMKSRQEAAVEVFRFLSKLPGERLDRIIFDRLFSGPSELGPIADAIKATSASLRSPTVTSYDGLGRVQDDGPDSPEK